MKFYELKNNDKFKAEFHDKKTGKVVQTITGTFSKMDGMYGQCILDGVNYPDEMPFSLFSGNMEVELVVEKETK